MILGIECTAHTFGVGIVEKGKILANVRDMYTTADGGIIPMGSAKHHRDVAMKIYGKALKDSGVKEEEINAIAISNAPGLAPCLYEGLNFAKKKAMKLGIPLVGVNHCIAHLEIGRSVGAKDPVLLYASGANTQIIAYASGKYRVFGETLDLGVGNFIDKIGRFFGFGFPGGPSLEKEALGSSEEYFIELPYSIKGMDVSFSGMQTKMQQLYDKAENKEKAKKILAYSMQETAFAMLVEAAERAMAHTGKKELVLGGGVACNKRLQEMCEIMCRERGAEYYCPEKSLLVDNAAMIAYTGELMFEAGNTEKLEEIKVKPRERTDQVEVTWRN
jgi:glycoprotease/Kae1 family metallohydrolase